MFKTLRMCIAALCFIGLCLLFVDVSGLLHPHLAFLAKWQLVPAILAGSLATVIGLLLFTLLFGRAYCSTLCPLGVMQDCVARLNRKRRYSFSAGMHWLRVSALGVFILAFVFGATLVFDLLEPYSAFGRIAANLMTPVWTTGSNGMALAAQHLDSFAVGYTPVWQKGLTSLAVALATLVLLGILAWRNGRTWCNTLCPVGTLLGQINRIAVMRPRIDAEKCVSCGVCEHACKAGCISARDSTLDASRCVSCFNCLHVCRKDAISYRPLSGGRLTTKKVHEVVGDGENYQTSHPGEKVEIDSGRRAFFRSAMKSAGVLALPVNALSVKREKSIPALIRRKPPLRETPVIPPGSSGLSAYTAKCVGCQLCVSVCPNQVLRPSDTGIGALQPHMSFERGYCRVNCVACSAVCPTGAIKAITVEQKSAIQIGRARVTLELCIVTTDDVPCNACARNCPPNAINMVGEEGHKRPAVDAEKCTGCGACEYVCPARPLAAILVEGNLEHRKI